MDLYSDIAKRIEHSYLKPDATYKKIEDLCREAVENNFYGVCVNPFFVKFVKDLLKKTDLKVITVVGFPLGANRLKTKLIEASSAVNDGADELDIVWNIGAFKSKDYSYVEEELKTIIYYTQNVTHKIIVETAYLSQEEKEKAVQIVINLGAEFIKTSTGFAPEGAKLSDIKLFREKAKGKIKIKAAGGIRDFDTAVSMIKAGADRIGTSHGVDIIKGKR
ncbi:MAG TPA: deoxyribose-phosphate aldolase [Persephonella sp.]|uniref:Deoxyribose-phosphate aldolase n=1 Tax=Persephonella marina (strain DSM 14350 / EX-H1) TaxID=123214 RepID=C0QSF7_PERMH|nr:MULTISPECIES: deoxyribose-phosphate aldolase [Persephonella]ACO04305.1 deoxyribose-phosphate aldolase [Persephonella marina EX-H1]HCB69351.1 deoxyribose-phosphate aldolase [Persephonella sp.]